MRKIKAFSLVEMLITLAILSILMLIATLALNTIVRVSTIARYKTIARNEIEFAVEITDRLLSNSNISGVGIYNSRDVRTYDPINNLIISEDAVDLASIYTLSLAEGSSGNEIHVRPYGYGIWVCLGYFNDVDGNGYLIRRTVDSLNNHEDCFNTEIYTDDVIMILNSADVNVNSFNVSYTRNAVLNNVFYIDIAMEPNQWVPGDSSNISKDVFRQAIVTTAGLTWY